MEKKKEREKERIRMKGRTGIDLKRKMRSLLERE